MLRRSRAVSEVIASLIIILIVSVLGTSLYSYTLTATQLKQDVLQRDVQIESERAQERFSVIVCVQEGNLLNLTVLNYGRFDIEIVDIYVNGDRFILSPSKRILPSDLGHISITVPSIIPGAIYEIVVVSDRGVSYVYSWKA